MPHQAQKFGQEHWDAIERECVDGRESAAGFARRAKAGGVEGVAAFTISEQRVREIKGELIARRDRAAFQDIPDALKRSRKMAEQMISDAIAEQRATQLKRTDRAIKDLAQFDKLVTWIDRLERDRAKPSNGKPEPQPEDAAEQERKALERRLKSQAAPSTDTTHQPGEARQATDNGALAAQQPATQQRAETQA